MGLIIRNRSVWPTLFLLNVFTALKGTYFYAPNFEKVDGANCFWSVRAWVRGWVTLFVPTVTFKLLKLES